MSHQRTRVSAVVTLLVAVVTIGALFAPARLPQTGRRPSGPARVWRTAQRLDTADATAHDTGCQDPASATATHAFPVQRRAVWAADAGGPATVRTWAAAPRAVVTSTVFVDARPGTGLTTVRHGVRCLPIQPIRRTAGRAPPGVLRPTA